jgi:hypothetical protein
MPAKKAAKTKTPATSRKAKKSAKKSPANLSAQPSGSGFQQSYFNLRERLDAIEMGALYYLMSGETDQDKIRRAQQLMELLAEASSQITALISKPRTSVARSTARAMSLSSETTGDTENPCPDGWNLCEGVCVPYPCE